MKEQEERSTIEEPIVKGTMTCLEVITVRVANKEDLNNAIEFCTQVAETIVIGETVNLSMYRSTGSGSDLSLHIYRPPKSFSQEKSILGLRLAKGLSGFGIVSHTLWIEQNISAGNDG